MDAGSGLATYDIYVSENGGPFTLWLAGATLAQASFSGLPGRTYGFYAIATDNVGLRQATPSAAQATTQVGFALYLPVIRGDG